MIEIEVKKRFIVGVISDTHGLMRLGVKNIFKNVNLIIHAGDIGNAAIIQTLAEIAPVIAVRGNIDTENGLDRFPAVQKIRIGKFCLTVIHNIQEININTAGKNEMVIFGHSHKPLIERRDKTVLFNPGSAGRKRFSLPLSVGLITVTPNRIKPEIHYLNI